MNFVKVQRLAEFVVVQSLVSLETTAVSLHVGTLCVQALRSTIMKSPLLVARDASVASPIYCYQQETPT